MNGKSKQERDSIFTLLARNYLLFTLALLVFAGGIWVIWDLRVGYLHFGADWNALLHDPALTAGQYAELSRYLFEENALFVLDEDGTVLYASEEDTALEMTPGEVSCVPVYGERSEVTCTDFQDADGAQRHLVVQRFYDNDTGEMVMLLDEDYCVLSGGLDDRRTAYTRREIDYMTGALPAGCSLYRAEFLGEDGVKRIALLLEQWGGSPASQAEYEEQYRAAQLTWILFVPLCLGAAAWFVWRINCQVRKPLDQLNGAILSHMEGTPTQAAICDGPREIRQLGERFDLLSAQLAESEAERKRLDERRQKLIADISHDLKTPITVMAGYADAICDGKVPQTQVEHYLRAIREKAKALTVLINAFHEFSKVEHPDFTLNLASVDICEWSREYLAAAYDEITLAGFDLQVDIPEQAIVCLLDQFQFRRVLDNLFANSMRHNPPGTTLLFSAVPKGRTILLRVGDNGRGISAQQAETIFDPFVVGEASRSGTGSGLGLSIARHILEKHGGSISLNIPPRSGWSTEFLLELPTCFDMD